MERRLRGFGRQEPLESGIDGEAVFFEEWGSFIAAGNWAPRLPWQLTIRPPLGIERLGGKLVIGFFRRISTRPSASSVLLTLTGERDAFFEQLHRVVPKRVAALQAADNSSRRATSAQHQVFRGSGFLGAGDSRDQPVSFGGAYF